ncbi:MAG: hydrogenase maturation protease [Acidimicrobiales bacterium]|nr:hydrogenase maturation protease [Acidimicrobiales bacterium]
MTLVVGCGNLLRGDDAVGPVLVRMLAERGVPSGVQLADAGTAGMDVAFAMRGQDHVIVVDACSTGGEPGTLHRVAAEVVEQLPTATGLDLHGYRWDHALAFARWLLQDEYPAEVTAYLVEVASTELGDPLSPRVQDATERLAQLLLDELGRRGDGG